MGQIVDALSTAGAADDWMTPPAILEALGPFDLDPCAAPEPRPWPTAERHICRPDDGFNAAWAGRVWLNPPYLTAGQWIGRLAAHGTGTALVFARTETQWFASYVWRCASALLFLEGRLKFIRKGRAGGLNGHNAPAPSVLVAYGHADAEALAASGLRGALVQAWLPPITKEKPEALLLDLEAS